MFALLDCNNFYVACEQLFRPDLRGKPVVVLSNNDGCIVSRSAEAKALGIKMAVPLYQVKSLLHKHRAAVFSSNYALYADISARVMDIAAQHVPEIDVYSIDEAFLDVSHLACPQQRLESARELKNTIKKYVGIDVCVGIAPTKTLAKLANHAAKKYPATQGVVELSEASRQRRLMQITPVEHVWGVGKRISARLLQSNIQTALELAQAHPATLRSRFSVMLERTAYELNAKPCFTLDNAPAQRQQIISSRSFAAPITSYNSLLAAVNALLARAAERMRAEGLECRMLTVFIQPRLAGGYSAGGQRLSLSAELSLATLDTRELFKQAKALLEALWSPGQRYTKAGVVLLQLSAMHTGQEDLFAQPEQKAKQQRLMQVMDSINNSGKGNVTLASQTQHIHGLMRQAHRSPAYTTRWQDIPRVR